jgi:hypothetical protein
VFGLLKTVVILLTVMWMFIGNEEVWDELLAEHDLLSNNATEASTNTTEMMNDSINTVVESFVVDEF